MYKNSGLLTLLDDNHIDVSPNFNSSVILSNCVKVLKTFASGSAVSSPCDRGNCFKAAHAKTKFPDVVPQNHQHLHDKLMQLLAPYFPGTSSSNLIPTLACKVKMGGSKSGRLTPSSPQQNCFHSRSNWTRSSNRSLSLDIIHIQSNNNFGHRVVSRFCSQLLSRTSPACSQLGADAIYDVVKAIKAATLIVQNNGELTEEWFANNNVPPDLDEVSTKVKDTRSVHQRRAVVVTHETFLARLAEQAAEKQLEEAKKEETQKKKKKKKEEEKEAKEQEKDTKKKRKEILDLPFAKGTADDCMCLVCPATWCGYQQHGLEEQWEAKGARKVAVANIWKQCESCQKWFCPEHSQLLGGKHGHEAACPLQLQHFAKGSSRKRFNSIPKHLVDGLLSFVVVCFGLVALFPLENTQKQTYVVCRGPKAVRVE